jgi:hypothetical protein
MIKPSDPRQLAIDLLPRSICNVQVAAVLAHKHGIYAWAWNSVGNGLGEHAEAAAIRRANRNRLYGMDIYVASQRMRNKKIVNSKPCVDCQRLLDKYLITAYYRDADGEWKKV